jgi:hypothetical protein
MRRKKKANLDVCCIYIFPLKDNNDVDSRRTDHSSLLRRNISGEIEGTNSIAQDNIILLHHFYSI